MTALLGIGRREPVRPGGATYALDLADGTTLYTHAPDVHQVRRRVVKAQRLDRDFKLPDGRRYGADVARAVRAIRPATIEEVADMPEGDRDCRAWSRISASARERRAGLPRSDPRRTDPQAAGREPTAARQDRGLSILERFAAERRR